MTSNHTYRPYRLDTRRLEPAAFSAIGRAVLLTLASSPRERRRMETAMQNSQDLSMRDPIKPRDPYSDDNVCDPHLYQYRQRKNGLTDLPSIIIRNLSEYRSEAVDRAWLALDNAIHKCSHTHPKALQKNLFLLRGKVKPLWQNLVSSSVHAVEHELTAMGMVASCEAVINNNYEASATAQELVCLAS